MNMDTDTKLAIEAIQQDIKEINDKILELEEKIIDIYYQIDTDDEDL